MKTILTDIARTNKVRPRTLGPARHGPPHQSLPDIPGQTKSDLERSAVRATVLRARLSPTSPDKQSPTSNARRYAPRYVPCSEYFPSNEGELLLAPSIRGRTLFVRWCRVETGAEDRGAQRRAFEVGLCLSGDGGERLVRRTVSRSAEHSRSDFVCPVMSGRDWCGGPWRAAPSIRGRTLFVRGWRGEIGAEDRGGQGQAFEVGLCLSGDVGETLVRRTVAGRAVRSRSDFVCPGMSGRDWCGGPWRAGPSVRGRTLFVRGCRGEAGAEVRGGQGRMFEVGLCLSGDVGERLVRRTVAGRAERSRADFVCPGMSGRDWCGGPWRAGPSVRGRTLFVRGCRGGTGAEVRGVAFEVGLCLSGEHWRHRGCSGFGGIFVSTSRKRGGKLRQFYQVQTIWRKKESEKSFMKKCREREWRRTFPDVRSNETSEQREERLAAQRKRAAAKVFNESSKQREERLRAKRERAAVKLTQETSQERDIRLRVRRERAALKRQGESRPEGVGTNRRAQSRRDSDTRRRNQREAIFAGRRFPTGVRGGWAHDVRKGSQWCLCKKNFMCAYI